MTAWAHRMRVGAFSGRGQLAWSGDCLIPTPSGGSVTAFERIVRSRLLGLRGRLLSQVEPPRLREGTDQELREIEAALVRLAEGTFGLCERCGRALGQHRLL